MYKVIARRNPAHTFDVVTEKGVVLFRFIEGEGETTRERINGIEGVRVSRVVNAEARAATLCQKMNKEAREKEEEAEANFARWEDLRNSIQAILSRPINAYKIGFKEFMKQAEMSFTSAMQCRGMGLMDSEAEAEIATMIFTWFKELECLAGDTVAFDEKKHGSELQHLVGHPEKVLGVFREYLGRVIDHFKDGALQPYNLPEFSSTNLIANRADVSKAKARLKFLSDVLPELLKAKSIHDLNPTEEELNTYVRGV